MGNSNSLVRYVKNKAYGHQEVKILMCGLDAVGKTTILYKLKLGEVVTTVPTIGFNVETVEFKNISFISWDIGGRDKIRPVLRHYYHNADAILFVVDSNDRDRMDMSREELTRLLSEDELSDCILLVLANKQDLASSMSASQVEEKLQLHQIAKDRNYFVQGSCAVMGQGLYEGVDWLHGQLIQKAAKLSVSKPLAETKDAVGKSGLFSLVYSSLESYWPFNT